MRELGKELKLIINRELYQKHIISLEEFRIVNEEIMKENNDEYSKDTQ